MYRPPENCNRVKSIKSRFENVENSNFNLKKNDPRPDIINKDKDSNSAKWFSQNLSEQLSDASRRNVKRSPAFRIDVNAEKNNTFQRTAACNRSFYLERVQQYAVLKTSSDNKKNLQDKVNVNTEEKAKESDLKPSLIKSKSSIDFTLIRSKFEKTPVLEKKLNKIEIIPVKSEKKDVDNISCLYAKPIPKALQHKNRKTEENNEINNAKTLPLREHTTNERVCDIKDSDGFTDTLKAALKKPLPNGPAPQKPPRTFLHAPPAEANNKNISFLYHDRKKDDKIVTNAKTQQKHDPRYMLSKLECALRNNKIKTKTPVKLESFTTSSEDSDDSVLYKSKSHSQPSSAPISSQNAQSFFNFNCFNGLTVAKPTYETIKEPNSSFFVSCQPEPVYAEPFNVMQDSCKSDAINNLKNERTAKSLHYMSTSLLNEEENNDCIIMEKMLNQQMSPDNSSISSATSELDPPVVENSSPETSKIKKLIDNFETIQISNHSQNDNQCHVSFDGSRRIQELQSSINRTIENSFNDETKDCNDKCTTDRPASVDAIINKFQNYVKTMPKYQIPKIARDDCLFYCCLVVGWTADKPKIKFRYPPNVQIPHRIEDLCYPEAISGPLDISDNAQCYSLVITNDKGERTFGYCRRVIPEGSTKCIPLTYCLLSKHRAPRFYKKLLFELESRHGIPDKLRDELISKLYNNKFPRPGESIKINLTSDGTKNGHSRSVIKNGDAKADFKSSLEDFIFINMNGKTDTSIDRDENSLELSLTLHRDTRYEEADLKPLHTLPSHILLKIFASLLLERKVILISCVISKLSSCVDALQSILYPFSWPHTFIPILPQCLWDVVESPTPVICGILSVSVTNNHKIEHGIVVDLDERSIISEEGDEDNVLTHNLKKVWTEGLSLARTISPDDYSHSVFLSDAYIRVFILALKNYKGYIVNNTFEKEAFIKNSKTKCVRRFLRWFTETTMFISFIESVINNPDSFSLFDMKIEMYGSDKSKPILTKIRDWRR